MNRIRVGLAAAAVLVVGACGSMHPGSAVVVDDESISIDKVDTLADDICEAASASGQSDMAGADVRQQAASITLNLTGARQLADDLDLDVPESATAVSEDESSNLETQFPDADQSKLLEVVKLGKESSALLTAIGQDQAGPDASAKEVQQAGQQSVQEYLDKADVSIDPRYGTDDTGQPSDTQTLSALASGTDDDQDAASAANQCSS